VSETDERGRGRLEAPEASGGRLVSQLRSTLDRASELVRVLEESLAALGPGEGTGAGAEARVEELEGRLRRAETDVHELAGRLVESDHQAGRLMNLYVATYQLHASLQPEEVQRTVAEIASNLLGARSFVLLLRREGEGATSDVALTEGLRAEDALYAGDVYSGGDPRVDAALVDGVLAIGEGAAEGPVAAVPLRVQEHVVGALVVLRLLDHKPILRPEDRDLLDLLSAHAASALFAARLYAAKERKLESLRSLVELARGPQP
jgi:GAF domain-containing protein